jgi:hypothetical protein
MKPFVQVVLGAGLAGLVGLGVSGCAQPEQAGAGLQLTAEPLDAALVTPQFGWVLTADAMLLSHDGGKSFATADVGLKPGLSRAAYFRDAKQGWVASSDGTTISVSRTSDGGSTWNVSDIRSSEPIGTLSVGFGDANTGALMAKVQTSGAFSKAHLYGTADGGASWQEKSAPVAGKVAVEPGGRIWLAGGVLGNELYTSADSGGSWAKPALEVNGSTVDGVTLPANGVVSASVSNGASTRVAVLTSADGGANWRESASVPVKNSLGSAPSMAVRDSAVVVADPNGATLHKSTTKGAMSDASASGLPAGVNHLSFASAKEGWALASSGSCANGKRQCTVTYSVVSTVDAGASWHGVASWAEKLS